MPKVATRIDIDAVVAGVVEAPSNDEIDTAILDTAALLLVTGGIAEVEVDVVADRSGVGRSTIYRRFGSRNELLAAALAHEARRFLTALAADGDGDGVAGDGSTGDPIGGATATVVVDRVVDAFARGLAFARVAGLPALVRSEPLLLRLLTIDAAPLIAAAGDQLVAEARRRFPDVDADSVGRHGEILVRLAISCVVTPPVGNTAAADAAVLATVGHLVSMALRETTGEGSSPRWDARG